PTAGILKTPRCATLLPGRLFQGDRYVHFFIVAQDGQSHPVARLVMVDFRRKFLDRVHSLSLELHDNVATDGQTPLADSDLLRSAMKSSFGRRTALVHIDAHQTALGAQLKVACQ